MHLQFAVFVLALIGAGVSQAGETSKSPAKPNIVMIFADDWGFGDLSCHGNKTYPTPNLDRLARQGTDFHVFTVGNPVCSPSRAALMTGLFPARLGVHQHFAKVGQNRERDMPDWVDPNITMLPRLLQRAGYVTGHFGKWHLTNTGVPDAPLPALYGYDETAVFNGPGPQVNANPNKSQPLPTDKAIDFIRRNKGKPFFVNLWIHEPHTPHYPTQAWLEKFKHLPESQRPYAAVLAEADRRIGQFLDALDELNLADNTLVAFSSDNGPENTGKNRTIIDDSTGRGLGTYFSRGTTAGRRGRKRSLYNGGVGVPFIVRWPGHTPAGAIDKKSVITGVDLLPTFCAAAGVELPGNFKGDGQNMLPALLGKAIERERPIFWEWRGLNVGPYNWPQLGVQQGPWKLLMTYNQNRTELFQILEDEAEVKNLAKANPEVVRRLASMVLEWKKSLPTSPPAECCSKQRKGN